MGGAVFPGIAPRQSRKARGANRERLGQFLLEPGAEGPFEDARGLLFGEFFKGRIDDGLDRPLAQDLRAKGMDGSDGGFFQMLERVFDVGALRWVRAAARGPIPGAAEVSIRRRPCW